MATDAHAKLAVATWKGRTNLAAAHDVTIYTSYPTLSLFNSHYISFLGILM